MIEKDKSYEIRKYLFEKKIVEEVFDIEEMTGGIHNDVYHIFSDRGELVYKKHLSISKNFPDIVLPEGRYENEKNSYELLAKIFSKNVTPKLIYSDDAKKIIVLEYLEEGNRIDRKINSLELFDFFAMGEILAEIANLTYNKNEIASLFDKSEFQELKYEYRYYKFIENKELFKIRDDLMKSAKENRSVFSHGDPRFNNIFAQDDGVYFIDFEGAYFADASLDPSYLLSEILIYYFSTGKEEFKKMAESFWKGYIKTLKINIDMKNLERRIIKHCGFALLDKAIGVIKDDYSFISSEKVISRAEEIIISDKIVTFNSLFLK